LDARNLIFPRFAAGRRGETSSKNHDNGTGCHKTGQLQPIKLRDEETNGRERFDLVSAFCILHSAFDK
jgi:hypothetical protein